jgi:hypothetical protein
VLLYVRHCLVLGGYVQAGKSPTVQVPHIMGAPLGRFVSASIKYQHEGWTDSPELLDILKKQIQTTLKRSLANEIHSPL